MSADKRKYPRYPVEVAAELDAGQGIVVASTQNLSSGGVALLLEQPVAEGAQVQVTLFLTQDGIEDPEEQPIEARASVIWTAERDSGAYAVGVRFEAISSSQQKQLQRFLKALPEEE